MRVEPMDLPEVLLIRPRLYEDQRGNFFESYNRAEFADATGCDAGFVQDNHSRSIRGVLRGLHYQLPDAAQGKLVRVLSGEVFDVAVDVRRGSPRFGRWTARRLSAENRLQMWIPEGFAHGFLTLSAVAEVEYKVTAYYDSEAQRAIRWDDPAIGIEWGAQEPPILSARDAQAPLLDAADPFPG